MSQTVRGVISRSKQQPVELGDVVIPDPGPNEVVVDVISCGVCHTDLTYREGGINGDCLPERDFPTLISLYREGRLPLEKFVSERIGLDGIEDAFRKVHAGEVLRSVVIL